tara:strand:+ start:538 stop:648 length:111 start_codon:yes stop_codon:yes gene_type:complete
VDKNTLVHRLRFLWKKEKEIDVCFYAFSTAKASIYQ